MLASIARINSFSPWREKAKTRVPEAMKKADIDYWARNRERMRYGALRAAQVPIGSGAVESSVRRVINLWPGRFTSEWP